MKKIIASAAAFAMAASLLVGCGSAPAQSTASSTAASAAAPAASSAAPVETLSGKVATGGSTSMEKVIAALQESFMETYSDVDVTYDPTGSGAGITGAQEGSLDIGLSSRGLKESETGVTAIPVALDGIAVIVNNENPVSDLSISQIAAIAKGEVTDWSELGGEGEIVLIGREAGSGTRDGFESIVGVSDECVYSQELTATGAVIAAVQSNPNAIGYASLSALDDTVKAVTVEGVACTEETVLDGSYKIQRPFNFVVSDTAEKTPAVEAFIEFATSAEASDLISAAGAVPLK